MRKNKKLSWSYIRPYLFSRYFGPVAWYFIISLIAFIFPTRPVNQFLFGMSGVRDIMYWYNHYFFSSYAWKKLFQTGYYNWTGLNDGFYFWFLLFLITVIVFRMIQDYYKKMRNG